MGTRIRVVLADDEPLARAGLRDLLARHPDMELCAECRAGREVVETVRKLSPDLLLLDVQMPDLDGLSVVRVLGPAQMPPTIFITAFDSFAVDAFGVQAVDYLLKPVDEPRFDEALRRARLRIRQDELLALARNIAPAADETEARAPSTPLRQIAVRMGTRDILVSVDEIDWIEAEDYCITLHCGPRAHLLRESLTALETQLPGDRFQRIHRSAIVNLRRVRELLHLEHQGLAVLLEDGTRLPVSRRKRRELVSRFGRAR